MLPRTSTTANKTLKRQRGAPADWDQWPEWPASMRRARDAGARAVVPDATTELFLGHGGGQPSRSVEISRGQADV